MGTSECSTSARNWSRRGICRQELHRPCRRSWCPNDNHGCVVVDTVSIFANQDSCVGRRGFKQISRGQGPNERPAAGWRRFFNAKTPRRRARKESGARVRTLCPSLIPLRTSRLCVESIRAKPPQDLRSARGRGRRPAPDFDLRDHWSRLCGQAGSLPTSLRSRSAGRRRRGRP